jgi:ADP-heptose:LPS heptosyltransferase
MVLTTPLFKILKNRFPTATISVLTKSGIRDIIEGNPLIDNIIIHRSLREDIRTLRGRFDIVIDPLMNYVLAPAIISRFINAPCSIGFDIGHRGLLFTSPVRLSTEHKHFTAHLSDLLLPMDIVINKTELMPEIYCKDSSILPGLPGKGNPLICVHPGGFYPSQRWPRDSFAQLITLCSQHYPEARFAIIGTEKDVISSIKNTLPQSTNLKVVSIQAKSLRDTIAIISRSALFIGNNSGLLHIATALQIPTVSTMGPTIQWLWNPCGLAERNIVVKSSARCESCEKDIGKEHTCLSSISVERMFSAVKKVNWR